MGSDTFIVHTYLDFIQNSKKQIKFLAILGTKMKASATVHLLVGRLHLDPN